MRMTVFQSDKGDCLLLTSTSGKNILVDGGMSKSFVDHVADELARLRQRGQGLDLVYVSHIDQDHIAGVLKLMDDILDWKVFHFQRANGNPTFPQPDSPEPPEVKAIWHNSFHEVLGKNAGPIEDMLAANASLLSALDLDWARGLAERAGDLATSMNEAARLSRRIGAGQLGIPLNRQYDHGLMFVSDPPTPIRLGSLRLSVIGPYAEDLKNLRDAWNKWLRSQQGRKQLRKIREDARDDERRLGADEFESFVGSVPLEAAALGDRDEVTPPNLASLMLLVTEGQKKALLTGDGHADDILAGLESCNQLAAGGGIHVDVLKIPHHGSEFNTTSDFCRRVTANHYVFCGNGAHHNPDTRVVTAYVDSRLGSPSKRSKNPEAGDPFRFWFNSSPTMQDAKFPAHMQEVRDLVDSAVGRSNGQMSGRFLRTSKFELQL
ncbi:MAG: MBL fold metallo-hydrolase [Thermoanaerobaculia bacterium]|jgi:hypothetical protein